MYGQHSTSASQRSALEMDGRSGRSNPDVTARKRSGRTVLDIAAAVGVTEGAVRQWESNQTRPRQAKALKLDETLGAGGEILASLGYALPSTRAGELDELRAEVNQLRARLDPLERAVRSLARLVHEDAESSTQLQELLADLDRPPSDGQPGGGQAVR